MTTLNLEESLRQDLSGLFSIGNVLQTEPDRLVFRATALAGSNLPEELAITVDLSENAERDFDRYREASFLRHPNLLRVIETGWLETAEGRLPYLVTEAPDVTLDSLLKHRSLSDGELIALARQVLAALAGLHAEDLVYGALRPASVWRVGDQWKLSDFSQLRMPGIVGVEETRQMEDLHKSAAPPEAARGDLISGWDIWSFEVMLKQMSQGKLPPELEAVIAASEAPSPAGRADAATLLGLLERSNNHVPRRKHAEVARPLPPSFVPVPPGRYGRRERAYEQGKPWTQSSAISRTRVLQIAAIGFAVLLVGLAFLYKRSHPNLSTQTHPGSLRAAGKREAAAAPTEPVPIPPQEIRSPAVPVHRVVDSKSEINALLEHWTDAIRTRDAVEQVACYAPVVAPYYGRRSMSASQLEAERQRVFANIGPVERFAISNIRWESLGAERAVVSFDKSWRFGGRRPFWGSARERLTMRAISGEWKITGEREIKVYRSHIAS